MKELLAEIRACQLCASDLPHGVNPVLAAHPNSKIAIIGQAPGRVVHQSGVPWNDKSGNRLREWLGVSEAEFYDAQQFALIPMGFCYPGTGKSGDLPPRKICAPQWHKLLMEQTSQLQLILLIGTYAQKYYLGKQAQRNLTETVKQAASYLPKQFLPLPHPSPRNNIWLKKNPWFELDTLPLLKMKVDEVLGRKNS